MNLTLEHILPYALGVALSPIAIAALVLILFSKLAKLNSIFFLLGWMIGIVLILNIAILLFGANTATSSQHLVITVWINSILGALFFFLAYRSWKRRIKPGETPHEPKWMKSVESITPLKSLGLGIFIVFINAKNFVLSTSAGIAIGQESTSFEEETILVALFVLIGSISILVPVVAFLLAGKKLQTPLENTRKWFVYHNNAILLILFLVLGIMMLSKVLRLL